MPTHFSTIQNSAKETAQFPQYMPSRDPSGAGSQAHSTLEPKRDNMLTEIKNKRDGENKQQQIELVSSRAGENRASQQPFSS